MITPTNEQLNLVTGQILDSCLTVHKEVGPGLLESVYEYCLMKEFEFRHISARSQVELSLFYKGHATGKSFFIDILVENEIIMELKSVERWNPVYEAQIISYLRLANKKIGILVNFNVALLREGYKRFVNNF